MIHLSNDRKLLEAKRRLLQADQRSRRALTQSAWIGQVPRRLVRALLFALVVAVPGCTTNTTLPDRSELQSGSEPSKGTPLRRLPVLATKPPSASLTWNTGTSTSRQDGSLYRSEWPDGEQVANRTRRIAWPGPQTAKGPIQLHFAASTPPSLLTVQDFSSVGSRRARPSGESHILLDCWPKAAPSPACEPTIAENEVIYELEIRPGSEGLTVFAGWPYNPRKGALDSATASYLFRIVAQ